MSSIVHSVVTGAAQVGPTLSVSTGSWNGDPAHVPVPVGALHRQRVRRVDEHPGRDELDVYAAKLLRAKRKLTVAVTASADNGGAKPAKASRSITVKRPR